MTRRVRHLLVPILGAVLSVALVGCGGGGGGSDNAKVSPADALASAKKKMDAAPGFDMTLETDSRPKSGSAVLSATGHGTHQPAWKGKVDVLLNGLSATVPIVSVDGKVHAQLPLTSSYAVIDPAEYDAPDPADFMSPDTGLSALLSQITDPKKKGEARAGSEIVTIYTGQLPGAAIKSIIPSASADATYEISVNLRDDGYVSSVSVTGPFFSGSGDVTYRMTFSNYEQDVTITAP